MSMKPSRTFMGKVRKHVIGLETLLRLSQHGDGCYAFVPKDIVDCFHLLPGDRVQVKLVASYRLISSLEEEAVREEKVEPILVVPRQRRRRRKRNLDSDSEFQETTEKEDVEPQESTENEAEPRPDLEEEEGIEEGELLQNE